MKAVVKCKLFLYADDSALLPSSCDVSKIEEILKQEMESFTELLAENRLSLHLDKTKSIIFDSNKRLAKCKELNITFNGMNFLVGVRGLILCFILISVANALSKPVLIIGFV